MEVLVPSYHPCLSVAVSTHRPNPAPLEALQRPVVNALSILSVCSRTARLLASPLALYISVNFTHPMRVRFSGSAACTVEGEGKGKPSPAVAQRKVVLVLVPIKFIPQINTQDFFPLRHLQTSTYVREKPAEPHRDPRFILTAKSARNVLSPLKNQYERYPS